VGVGREQAGRGDSGAVRARASFGPVFLFLTCLVIPSVMSTFDLRQLTHVLAGFA